MGERPFISHNLWWSSDFSVLGGCGFKRHHQAEKVCEETYRQPSEIVTRKNSQPCAFSIWNTCVGSWALREKMEKGQAYVFCLANLFECLVCRRNRRRTWFYQRCMSFALETFQKPVLSGNVNGCDMLGKSQYGFCRPMLSYMTPLVLERCFQVHGRGDQVGWSSGPHWNISTQGIKEKSIMGE